MKVASKNAPPGERSLIQAATNTGKKTEPQISDHPNAVNAGLIAKLVPVAPVDRHDPAGQVVIAAILEPGVAQHP